MGILLRWNHCFQVLGIMHLYMNFSFALLEVHVEQTTVIAVEGQSIVLPVWYSTNSLKSPYITWSIERASKKEVQILKYMGDVTTVQEPQFKNRLGFVYPMPSRNISIIINSTQEIDSGQYKCVVNVEDDDSSGGGNIGEINVTVLVIPSVPVCQIHGNPYVGSNITLSCKSSSGKPDPSYTWTRTSPTTQYYFSPAQDSVKGTLTLTNLTFEMSGVYLCTSKNIAGSRTCNITMDVTSFSRTAVIVGAVVGSIVGVFCLAILVGVLFYFYRCKKKDSQDEMENDIKEDAQAPKTLTWAKGNGSDIVFKNGTLSSVNTNREHKSYASKSPSETGSVITAAGSNVGFKPNYAHNASGVTTPSPSLSSQTLPTYMPPQNGNFYNTAMPANRNTLQKTNGMEHQPPRKELHITSGVTPSNLVRMGAVPVMVPAQSQAGSLV
ncbi:endothelial cell-selective adhesion molecule [Bombina bombina]|uniref:endothelial cell-selective adhesion molecule n=1 Tax=Bombina bombina TaxID=8345 RepID=UPI00235A725A|nr:endothelial cell-selective adhesion molecule [Bombina bombina]